VAAQWTLSTLVSTRQFDHRAHAQIGWHTEKNSFGAVACQQDTVEAETKANMLSPQNAIFFIP